MAAAEELRLLTWNVESQDSDAQVIATQLAALSGYHVYGLTDVDPARAESYTRAMGGRFASHLTSSGDERRALLLYDTKRLERLSTEELVSHQSLRLRAPEGGNRAPLVTRFRDRPSGIEFLFVLVHLADEHAELHREQAEALRLWVEEQRLPVIAMGHYGFAFNYTKLRGNRAFDEHMLDYRWRWVRPHPLEDTQWTDANGDGKDDDPKTCQDFLYLGAAAYNWSATVQVIKRDDDFPDSAQKSRNRPIEAVIEVRSEK
jgi:hypothetical protein